MGYEIGKLTRLVLGYVGENESRTIDIDVSEWKTKWPNAVISARACRPDEPILYSPSIETSGNTLSWTVVRYDVAIAGNGYIQFTAKDADTGVIYKSRVAGTVIYESAEGSVDGVPPDSAVDWVNNVTTAANQINNLKVTAKTLGPGSSATASYSNGTLALGIPTGANGINVDSNLLHNSNMVSPVNQRGATTYTGTGTYTIDRWFLTGNNTKCLVRTADVRVETIVGSSYATLAQKVANIQQYAGKTLTLAARVYSNVIPQMYVRDISGETAVTLGARARGTASAFNILLTSFTVPSNATEGNIEVLIQSQSTAPGDYINIYWAALYEGEYTSDTLPEYQRKPFSAELLECQRYFLSVRGGAGYPVGLGNVYAAGSGRILIPTPVQMRTNPTVSIEYDSTEGEPKLTVNGSQYSVTAFASPTARTNGVHVAATAGSAPAHQPCTLILSQAGKLYLSADL